jgi:SAM-dependent methyltransferase
MEKDKNSDIRFDSYVDNYQQKIQESIDFAGQGADFFVQVKAEMVMELVKKYCGDFNSVKVLDIGSGVGLVDRYLAPRIKNLYGVDIEDGVVNKAKVNNPSVNYLKYDGEQLPFEDNSFNFAFAINVMHHIPPSQWQDFTSEMKRILIPGGIAAVFEHNPVNPLTRRVVSKCEFDRDAVLLSHNKITNLFMNSKFAITEDAYILFFPFKGKFFRVIEKGLKWIPLGAQHFIIGKKV